MARSKQPARRSFNDLVVQAKWSEGVTLMPQQFTRAREIVDYAEASTGGDIAAAIIELVNTGLSHQFS